MGKPVLLAIAPVLSQSGYGKHAADLVRCLIRLDKFDVKIWNIRWGATPLNALTPGKDDDIISRLMPVPQLPKQPEVSFQVTIPPEFQPIGMFNIGVTAGIETSVCNPTWIDGLNRMNLNIVPSLHSKVVFEKSEFTKNDQQGRPIGYMKLEKPVEVLFEGADTNIYKRTDQLPDTITAELKNIPEDFCFLYVGHWLQGNIGADRKDTGMLIKVFLETFKDRENPPALLLKASSATFSVLDREELLKKIAYIKQLVPGKLPNVYLLHGQLTDEEMNGLYNHPKVKCMATFTKGEGFCRPLLEFSLCGKPIIASGWSGHLDFLDKDMSILLPGKIGPVDQTAVNDFIIKDSQWFTTDYNAAAGFLKEVFENYNKHLSRSRKLMYQNKETFSLNDMQRKMSILLNKYVPEFPEEVQLKLPIKKISLPKIAKPTTPVSGGQNA
jgi:glycosyltransferase involved in cell wall biosynthesis